MHLSFWEKNTYFNNIDVAIIGSGIVGLNAALNLKKKNKNLNIIILERGSLPMGASSKNAGFACFGSPSELLDDLKNHSESEVFALVEKRWKGLQRLTKNLGKENIDFHNWGGYEVFDTKAAFSHCAEKIDYLNRQTAAIIGKKVVYKVANDEVKLFGLKRIKHLILNTAEGQIDTGRMIDVLTKKVRSLGVEIINGFDVKKIEDNESNVDIVSKEGIEINSKRVIIATNGFAKQLLPTYDVQPARAQVLITKPIKGLKLKGTFHYQSGYFYFRNVGNRVLLGGGRNLDFVTEETTEFGLTLLVQNTLDEMLKEMIVPYAKPEVEMRWSGIMGVGNQKKSIVRVVSKNVFCAVRMGGMGVAIGSLVGEEVADLLLES